MKIIFSKDELKLLSIANINPQLYENIDEDTALDFSEKLYDEEAKYAEEKESSESFYLAKAYAKFADRIQDLI